MSGFAQICSNDAGRLADALADELARAPEGGEKNPLRLDWVVVPNPMTQHWLMESLARRAGVAAGVKFVSPRGFVECLCRAFAPGERAPSAYDADALAWALYERLGEGGLPPEPAHFLGEGGDLSQRYRLACEVAGRFESYLAYRPDMIAAWSAGRLLDADDAREAWQAALWRDVRARIPAGEKALHEQLPGLPERLAAAKAAVPARVCVFGISHLSPLFWDFFSAYAQVGELAVFAFQPTPNFWADLVSDKRRLALLERERRRRKRPDLTQEDVFLSQGTPLLGALGTQGQSFFKNLCDRGDDFSPDEAAFRLPEGASALARLQGECFRAFTEETPADCVAEGDDSIRLHVCHSPWREAQVLRDHILAWMEQDPSLRPGDIRVYVPDVKAYAPALRAVFARADRPDDIPLSIADPLPSPQDDAGEALLQMLALAHAPATFSQVADLLQLPPIAQSFGLEDEDFENLRRWAVSLNIRWGRDSAHLAREGAAADGAFTWRAGLDRLLVGTVFCDRAQVFSDDLTETFSIAETAGMIPSRAAGAARAESAGRIAHAVDALFAAVEQWEKSHTGARWGALIESALAQFFPDGAAWEDSLRRVREAACDLAARAGHLTLDVRVVAAFLRRRGAAYFFARQGGLDAVTVCALRDEKVFPARAVCVLGMGEGAFPRPGGAPSYDLMAIRPREGDASPRHADRYAFLQALLAARERVFLSYVGRNIADNAPHKAGERLPPSLLIDELENALRPHFASGQALRGWLCVDHPLQPFSPQYKTQGPLFTYGADLSPKPLEVAPLPLLNPAETELSIEALIRFFQNPAKAFLKAHDVALPFESASPKETETFDMENPQTRKLGNQLLALGQTRAAPAQRARAAVAGLLPQGDVGAAQWEDFSEKFGTFGEKLRDQRARGDVRACPALMHTECGPLRLETPTELFGDMLVLPSYAPVYETDRVRAWLMHLYANAAMNEPITTRAMGMPSDAKTASRDYRPVAPEAARAQLEALMRLRARGLAEPLPFAPKSALAWAQAKPEEGPAAARKAWESSDFSRGDDADEYLRLCWPNGPVEHPLFAQTVEAVFKNFTEEACS